jgi:hypothetical protein
MAEARGTSPLHQLCHSSHGENASFIAAVITQDQWQSVGQKNRMYSPTASPSRTAPSSSHLVLVMDRLQQDAEKVRHQKKTVIWFVWFVWSVWFFG